MIRLPETRILQPRRGRRQIERKALDCIEECCGKLNLSQVPLPVPVEDWIEGALGIAFGVADLSHLGDGLLGAAYTKEREILIDERVLEHEGRYRFTCAHELGHIVLHSNLRDIFHETPMAGPGSAEKVEREADLAGVVAVEGAADALLS